MLASYSLVTDNSAGGLTIIFEEVLKLPVGEPTHLTWTRLLRCVKYKFWENNASYSLYNDNSAGGLTIIFEEVLKLPVGATDPPDVDAFASLCEVETLLK